MKTIILFCLFLYSSIYSSDKIINSLISKYSPLYKKYSLVFFKKRIINISYSVKTKERLDSIFVLREEKSFFYDKKPIVKVLKYIKNGEKQEASSYKQGGIKPVYPLFDENSLKNYRFVRIGNIIWKGNKVVKYNVVPLKKQSQYYRGYVLIDEKNVKLLYSEGTLAKLPFPLKEMSFRVTYDKKGLFPVALSMKNSYRIYIPFVLSDRIIKSKVEILNYQLK